MPLIHTLASYINDDGRFSGLSGIQADQRDFSPFLVHFTSHRSMEILRKAIELKALPKDVHCLLDAADSESIETVKKLPNLKVCFRPGQEIKMAMSTKSANVFVFQNAIYQALFLMLKDMGDSVSFSGKVIYLILAASLVYM